MRIENGFGVFNGGINAGASQWHKHVHCFPYEYDKKYGTFLLVKNMENLIKLNMSYKNASFYRIKQFRFKHILVKFPESVKNRISLIDRKTSEKVGKDVHDIYLFAINSLNLMKDPVKLTTD